MFGINTLAQRVQAVALVGDSILPIQTDGTSLAALTVLCSPRLLRRPSFEKIRVQGARSDLATLAVRRCCALCHLPLCPRVALSPGLATTVTGVAYSCFNKFLRCTTAGGRLTDTATRDILKVGDTVAWLTYNIAALPPAFAVACIRCGARNPKPLVALDVALSGTTILTVTLIVNR